LDDKTDDKTKPDDLNVIVEVEFVVFSATDSPVFDVRNNGVNTGVIP
jgi:hypothetical protein